MSLPKSTSYQNGQTPASPKLGGAFVSSQELPINPSPLDNSPEPHARVRNSGRTVFPTDPQTLSLRTLFYGFTHGYFGGVTLFRWVIALIVVITLGGLVRGPLPWIPTVLIGLVVIVGLLLWRRILQKADFVRFEAAEPPTVVASASSNPQLDPADKLPVHVTGLFSVEGKDARLTWVPGFYRTFSTREHALLCQEQARRIFKVAETDLERAGMWYIFFQPEEITGMRWGSLYFGGKPRSAIAVDRKIEVKATGRFQRDKTKTETVYLAFLDLDEGHRIWADLHIDWEQEPAPVA